MTHKMHCASEQQIGQKRFTQVKYLNAVVSLEAIEKLTIMVIIEKWTIVTIIDTNSLIIKKVFVVLGITYITSLPYGV